MEEELAGRFAFESLGHMAWLLWPGLPANEHQARPECSGRAWKAAMSFARNDRSVRPQEIVTVTGGEAIPLATTTSVLLPAGMPAGRVNLVEDLVPGATDTEVQLLVRA